MASVEKSSANDNSKYRFTVDVSRRLADEIERIASETGRTKADVFRLAIELLSTARDAKSEGLMVGAWDNGTDKRHERVFVNFG